MCCYGTSVSISVILMSWSAIPCTFTEVFTRVGFETKTRARSLPSLVGVSYT